LCSDSSVWPCHRSPKRVLLLLTWHAAPLMALFVVLRHCSGIASAEFLSSRYRGSFRVTRASLATACQKSLFHVSAVSSASNNVSRMFSSRSRRSVPATSLHQRIRSATCINTVVNAQISSFGPGECLSHLDSSPRLRSLWLWSLWLLCFRCTSSSLAREA